MGAVSVMGWGWQGMPDLPEILPFEHARGSADAAGPPPKAGHCAGLQVGLNWLLEGLDSVCSGTAAAAWPLAGLLPRPLSPFSLEFRIMTCLQPHKKLLSFSPSVTVLAPPGSTP